MKATFEGQHPIDLSCPQRSNVKFSGGVVTWRPGTALGVCATESELWQMVSDGVLPVHPMNVPVKEWEITLALHDGSNSEIHVAAAGARPASPDERDHFARVRGTDRSDTPAALEVGAVGGKLSEGDDEADAVYRETAARLFASGQRLRARNRLRPGDVVYRHHYTLCRKTVTARFTSSSTRQGVVATR